jgi:AmmeMemoRadiSam system protein A
MSGALHPNERLELLKLARRAIAACLAGESIDTATASERLREPGGAFVTLRRCESHALRGCIGYIEPRFPLAETIVRAACLAATEDTRFAPVGSDELAGLTIEISALDPPRPARPEEVEVGKHGLIVKRLRFQGLLLPQVATEQGWDRETFLDQTCRKAGLPLDAWRQPDTEILIFSATVFGEEDFEEELRNTPST